MTRVEQSILVDVPLSTAYNQWTQFEEFPAFMEGVKEVRQLDDTHLRWTAEIAGRSREWDAVITSQVPDERIAWSSTSGAKNDGVVFFRRTAEGKTRIDLTLEWEPEGAIETVGAAVGAVEMRARGDLERFKRFIEGRSSETGAWRGEVERGQPVGSASAGSAGGAPTVPSNPDEPGMNVPEGTPTEPR
jgi:uncharacterized membrane protein